jgi:hypothetical protein
MALGSKENYINAAAIYVWDELPQASTEGEACLTTIFRILLVSQISKTVTRVTQKYEVT